MRGRTLNDAFIILDEAQNTTSEQMKMFLTRIGFGSKAVVTGDITQIDLPQGKTSGLREAQQVLSKIEGIRFVLFDERDVVRHTLVQSIITAYEALDREREAAAARAAGPASPAPLRTSMSDDAPAGRNDDRFSAPPGRRRPATASRRRAGTAPVALGARPTSSSRPWRSRRRCPSATRPRDAGHGRAAATSWLRAT